MKLKTCLLFLAILSIGMISFGQPLEKREYEQSVKMEQVPVQILEYISPFLDQSKKVKYFKESDGEVLTWEIKLKYQGRQFSIEFFDDQSLKDIEELVKWKRLEAAARIPVSIYFESNYKRFRIKRFQKQYLPQEETDTAAFIARILTKDMLPPDGYEIEAEVRSHCGGDFGFYEFQFDASFNQVSKRKIIPVTDGNLLF